MATDLPPRASFLFGRDADSVSETENSTWRNESTLKIYFTRPLHLNLVMLGLGALVTVVNAALLHRMHQRRSSLKAKRFVFLANLTFCDLLAGLLLVLLSVANSVGVDGPLVCIFQGETCLNLCLTMCSYSCSIGIQFIAVKYPIYYKTTITKSKVAVVLAICWIVATVSSMIKVVYILSLNYQHRLAEILSCYPYLDLTLRIVYVVGNCACFLYVLNVALRRCQQSTASAMATSHYKGRHAAENGKDIEDDGVDENHPFRRKAVAYIHHYDAILTSGMRLLAYVGSCLPHTIYSAALLISGNPAKIYRETGELGVSLVLLWFCRSVLDPLITLVREKPMSQRRTSTSSSGQGTIMSFLKSSRAEKRRAYSGQSCLDKKHPVGTV